MVPGHRDVAAFDERAEAYEQGWLGRLHHKIAERSAEVALSWQPQPIRILDVGCGVGYLLRLMATRCPQAAELTGIDPAPAMVRVARAATVDPRVSFQVGVAERLPYADHAFDLILSTTSFDHWADQRAGARECARVLALGGHVILADLFSPLLIPTLVGRRRAKARTTTRANRLLSAAGLRVLAWNNVLPLIRSAVAIRA